MSLHIKATDWVLNLGIAASVWSMLFLGQAIETTARSGRFSDPVLLAIVGGVVTVVTTVFGGIMTYFLAKIQRQGAWAAVKVEEATVAVQQVARKAEEAAVAAVEVKETLAKVTQDTATQMNAIQDLGKDTHTLVNANMGIALTVNVIALRRVVVSSSKEVMGDKYNAEIHMQDVAGLEKAERLLKEHEIKQAKVDHEVREREKKR